jgi:hypothetical protein
MKNKVIAYITQGKRLLVFRHTQAPEAGIQVPGGTIEEPETWLSYEWYPSDGSPAPIELEFFWVNLDDPSLELSGDQGARITRINHSARNHA